jgi:hypothetical protein
MATEIVQGDCELAVREVLCCGLRLGLNHHEWPERVDGWAFAGEQDAGLGCVAADLRMWSADSNI